MSDMKENDLFSLRLIRDKERKRKWFLEERNCMQCCVQFVPHAKENANQKTRNFLAYHISWRIFWIYASTTLFDLQFSVIGMKHIDIELLYADNNIP